MNLSKIIPDIQILLYVSHMHLTTFSKVWDRLEFWSCSIIVGFLLDSKPNQNKKLYNKWQEPKSKFPYYYAVILPLSLTSEVDSLFHIIYIYIFSIRHKVALINQSGLHKKRRNGTERASNFIAAITNYIVSLIRLKEMADGKMSLILVIFEDVTILT